MNVLDLFSGIGGFSLGLERAGMRAVAFCESDVFCRRVLAKHWPSVPIYDDVRSLTADRLRADGIIPDVICGGFPCQDISVAGKNAGLAGERSGLWSEYARIIGEVRPRYIIVENVAALLGRGLNRVLGDLAALGYNAEWHCIPASAVGAPHRRDRIWIVAYPNRVGRASRLSDADEGAGGRDADGGGIGADVAYPAWDVRREQASGGAERKRIGASGQSVSDVADANGPRLEIGPRTLAEWAHAATAGSGWWFTESDVGRVAHGVPARVDRLRALGNAVVPQIPEIIGRAMMRQHAHESEWERMTRP